MLTRDLVNAVAETVPVQKQIIAQVVRGIVSVVQYQLARNEDVSLGGLGRFGVGVRRAKVGRHPKTGNRINIRAKRIVVFKPSKITADAVT